MGKHRYELYSTPWRQGLACGVVTDIIEDSSPPTYLIEIFNYPGSCGDGVVEMYEDGDSLEPVCPISLQRILL